MSFPGGGEFLGQMNAGIHQQLVMQQLMRQGAGGSAEMLAGGLMSRMGAVGAPMLSGIQGMLGLDPMMLGLRAASSVWGAGGGLMGAGAVGMGVAGGLGIAGAVGQYAGSQMYSGAQQQMQLNSALRQNFNFMNAQGGMGFTSNQGFQIGGALRSMTHDFGPAGEVTSFGELSRLASNMGRMGMAQNVRSVKEFKDKFKEMVGTLKTIAHDMGSSLEEAQKFMQSMKGSGIFNKADQVRMAHGTRINALGGGLAMSEVTGMSSIGSQIARSVGGLGGAGAFAGATTIGQIGAAERVGALSEEDIYNATGLTGAEGRQALATSQLQRSARFLTHGRGRRFLASMAGANGQLNDRSAMEYLMGGVTTGRTMEMAHQNLAGVGRANFIRNEGRLRGEVLKKFGGLAQTMAYQNWLGSRGYDPSDMDDRAMLAFQRFSGMGRDEADAAIKQINALPEIMQHMQHTEQMSKYSDRLSHRRKTQGIEGLRRKWEQTQEHVNNKLQAAGADILRVGTETVARWFNEQMDIYESTAAEDIDESLQLIKMGGSGAHRIQQGLFGTKGSRAAGAQFAASMGFMGKTLSKSDQASLKEFASLSAGAAGGTNDPAIRAFARMNKNIVQQATMSGIEMDSRRSMMAFETSLRSQGTPAARLMADRIKNAATPAEKAAIIQQMQQDVGIAKESQLATHLGKDREKFEQELLLGGAAHMGADRDAAIGRLLSGQDTDEMAFQGTAKEKLARVGLTAGAAMGGYVVAASARATAAMSKAAVGGLSSLLHGDVKEGLSKIVGGYAAAGKAVFETPHEVNKRIQEATYSLFGDKQKHAAMAQMLRDPSIRSEVAAIMGGEGSEQDRSKVMSRITALREQKRGGKELSDHDAGELELLSNVDVVSKNRAALSKLANGQTLSKAEMDKLASDYFDSTGKVLDTRKGSADLSRLTNFHAYAGFTMGAQQVENARKAVENLRGEQEAARHTAVAMGTAKYDPKTKKYTIAADEKTMKGLSAQEKELEKISTSMLNVDLVSGTDEERFRHADQYIKSAQESRKIISHLSLKQKQDFARRHAGEELGMFAGASARRERAYGKAERRYGEFGALTHTLGLDVDKDVLRKLQHQFAGAKDEKAQAQIVEELLHQGGVKLGEGSQLSKGIQEALKEKGGARADALARAMAQASPEERKALQEARTSQENPQARATFEIRDAAKEQTKLLKALVQSNSDAAKELSKLNSKDGGEGKGQPPPT